MFDENSKLFLDTGAPQTAHSLHFRRFTRDEVEEMEQCAKYLVVMKSELEQAWPTSMRKKMACAILLSTSILVILLILVFGATMLLLLAFTLPLITYARSLYDDSYQL